MAVATPAQRAYRDLAGRLERAQRAFKVAALAQLHPTLTGPMLQEALGRERRFDRAYSRNMRARLREGVRALYRDRSLSEAERGGRLEDLARRERSHLQKHIAAAGRRMGKEAEAHRLREAGEPRAVWVLGRTRNHTPDCVAMANRSWTWKVLEKVNPANRHAGCDCSLISEGEAKRRGISFKPGRASAALVYATHLFEGLVLVEGGEVLIGTTIEEAELAEAEVQVRRYLRRKPGGGYVWVDAYTQVRHFGHVSPQVDAEFQDLVDAVQAGDLSAVDDAHAALRAEARRIPDKFERGETLRTADRVRALAANPGNAPTRVGEPVADPEAGVVRRVPIQPLEREGVSEPWGADGRFRWALDAAELRADQIETLRRSKTLDVSVRGKTATMATKRKLAPELAQAAARDLELRNNLMRRQRMVDANTVFDDDRPLDVHDLEPHAPGAGELGTETGLRHITRAQLGQAGEATIGAVAERLVALGLIEKGDEVHWETAGGQTPIDWKFGAIFGEVKSEPWRGLTAGTKDIRQGGRVGGPSITREAQAKKIADMLAENTIRARDGRPPVTPLLFTLLVDADHNRVHVVATRYAKPKYRYSKDELWGKVDPRTGERKGGIFSSRRLLVGLMTDLVDGKATPGQIYTPTTGEGAFDEDRGSIYVGTFALPINPLASGQSGVARSGDRGTRQLRKIAGLDPDTGRARAGQVPTTARPAAALDVLPARPGLIAPTRTSAPRPAPQPGRKPGRPKGSGKLPDAEHRKIIARLAKGESQGSIAADYGVSQPAISQLKQRWEREHGPIRKRR